MPNPIFSYMSGLRYALFSIVVATILVACTGAGSMPGVHPPPGGSPTPPPPPVRDDWAMYGHDARHSSASAASINGPLKVAWRYNPQAAAGNTFASVYNAIATINGVYFHWFQSAPTILGAGPSVDGLSISGGHMWTFIEKRDFDEGHWLSFFNNNVVYEDDGEGLLNPNSGALVKSIVSSYDAWGETIPDASGLYGANTFLADGPDLFVYSLDTNGASRWKALQQKSTKYSQDSAGGIVLSNGVLFYAASYSDPNPFPSGIYALDASTGHQSGYVATNVVSEMSADASNIYVFEQGLGLVARAQSNLHVVWSLNIFGSPSAPVVANGLVIVASNGGIEAHNVSDGKKAWSSPVSPSYGGQFGTAMCAALGSNTLLVTAVNGNLHLLNLANGNEIWHGGVAGSIGTVANPIIVNDPARGATVYVTDTRGVIALIPG